MNIVAGTDGGLQLLLNLELYENPLTIEENSGLQVTINTAGTT
jgi:hypothetical protein